jgi:hypothetical protein
MDISKLYTTKTKVSLPVGLANYLYNFQLLKFVLWCQILNKKHLIIHNELNGPLTELRNLFCNTQVAKLFSLFEIRLFKSTCVCVLTLREENKQ